MKKNLFFLSLLIVALVTMNSCKKAAPTAMEIDKSKTANITGYVYAQLELVDDYNDGTTWEKAPSGTKIFVTVANNQYVSGAQGYAVYETTVGADGRYSLDIPTDIDGVNIEVELVDFEYEQVQARYDAGEGEWVADGTERMVYSTSSWYPNISVGNVKIHDFYYYN